MARVFWKRAFDIIASSAGLAVFWPLILCCWCVAAIETRSNGFFIQPRIGRYGRVIRVAKIKTMYVTAEARSTIAAENSALITRSGKVFRKYKLDELPQLFNVLSGSMSFVGPRPDVAGYADRLVGADRVLLELRPGITGPASIKYRHEEDILSSVPNPLTYNDEVIWPDKVAINTQYFREFSLRGDLSIIWRTLTG